MSYPTCFGRYEYEYEYICFRCRCCYKCLEYTKAKERMNMNTYKKEETKEERKLRLDKEWERQLPCADCHPKMQRLCKHFNTFKRPDYNTEQFHIHDITCDDRIDPPAPQVVTPDMIGKPEVASISFTAPMDSCGISNSHIMQFGDSGGDIRD